MLDAPARSLLIVVSFSPKASRKEYAKLPIHLSPSKSYLSFEGIKVIAKFDNSPNNPLNPDPKKLVRWGSASEDEMVDVWIEYVDVVTTSDAGGPPIAPPLRN